MRCRFDDGSAGPFAVPGGATAATTDIAAQPKQGWARAEDRDRFVEDLRAAALDFGSLEALCAEEHAVDRSTSAGRSPLQLLPAGEQAGLRRWIEGLQRFGIALVKNMPAAPGQLRRFAERLFGFVLQTHYGPEFVIKAVERPNNLAYSSLGLQLHTDLPFYQTAPPIQLFHCIEQARVGGENIFADGRGAAERLRAEDPDAFALLASRSVRFQDWTPAWELHAEQRTIDLGPDGEVSRVHFNERTRDSWHQWRATDDVDDMDAFYRALSRFEALLEDTHASLTVTLQPGEMSVIDNWRVLHSRGSFEGNRHLEGGYITWEQAHSLWRVLSSGRQ